jgi:hypothetical protein
VSNLKKNLLLLFSSVLFTFFVAEIILRLFVTQETKRLAIYDKDLGWRGRPNGSGRYIRKEDGINTPFSYNELGFRDNPIAPRSSVMRRYALLGDSFLENLEVPYEKTFLAQLKQKLRSSYSDAVALMSQGYSTAQELKALQKFYDPVQPDAVVLLFYTGNDFEDNLRREFAYLDEHGELVFPENKDSWLKQQNLTFQRWLYETSHLVFYIKNFLASRAAIKLEDDSKKVKDESKEYKFNITRKLILAAKAYADERGVPFGLAVFTNKYELRDNQMEKTEFVERVCTEAGIPVLSFKDLQYDRHYFPVDIHFNEEGHRVVAARLFDFLTSTFGLNPDTVGAAVVSK